MDKIKTSRWGTRQSLGSVWKIIKWKTDFVSKHYFFTADVPRDFKYTCKKFLPFEKKDDQSAEKHVFYIKYAFKLYRKTSKTLSAIHAHNFATDKYVEDIVAWKFIGGASHCHNFVIKNDVDYNMKHFEHVIRIASKTSFLFSDTELGYATRTVPIKSTAAKRALVKAMITCFVQIRNHVLSFQAMQFKNSHLSLADDNNNNVQMDNIETLGSFTTAVEGALLSLLSTVVNFYTNTDNLNDFEARLQSSTSLYKVLNLKLLFPTCRKNGY